MKERLQIIDYKYKIALFSFFFFLIISALSPISGTDWASYLIGKEGIKSCIKNAYIYDGRVISGILVNFLSYNKIIFDIIFAGLMSKFISCCNNMMGTVKNKYYYLFPFFGTLLVSVFLFSYNYTSVTTTVTYTFPAISSFIYFEYLWKKENYKFNLKELTLLSLLALFISLSSIYIAIVFLLGNLMYSCYYLYNNKKFSKTYLIVVLLQVISIALSLTLIDKNILYANLNISLSNLPKYIDSIFSKNIVLILLGAIPINFYLNEKLKGWVYNRVVITLFDLILMFSLAYNFFYYSPVNLNLVINKYFGVFATENWYYIFYFLIYIALYFLSIKYFVTSKKTNLFLRILSITSFAMSLFLLASPIWDEGNVIYIVLFLILSMSIMLKDLKIKIYPKTTVAILTIIISYYIISFFMIKYIDFTRGEYIKEQVESNQEIIEIKANPIYLVWRHNPVNIFQHRTFKKYYNIPEKKAIKVKYFGIFEKIEKKVKE